MRGDGGMGGWGDDGGMRQEEEGEEEGMGRDGRLEVGGRGEREEEHPHHRKKFEPSIHLNYSTPFSTIQPHLPSPLKYLKKIANRM